MVICGSALIVAGLGIWVISETDDGDASVAALALGAILATLCFLLIARKHEPPHPP